MKRDRSGFIGLRFVLIVASSFFIYLNTAVSSEKIIIGQSAAFQGASSALGRELWKGAAAFFLDLNSNGGIKGKHIEVRALDDSYNGDKTLSNTIQLVRDENVFALFGYVGTPTIVRALPAIHKFNHEKKMFLFSNFTGAQPQRQAPYSEFVFNVRSSYRQETAGIVENLVALGIKKIGVFAQNDAYGRSGIDGVERALKKFNLKIAAEATYERGASFDQTMSEHVQILKDTDAVVSIGSYNGCGAFIRDMRKAGYKGFIANVSFVGADALLKKLNEVKTEAGVDVTAKLINSQVVPLWDDESYPIVVEYRKAMEKYKPKLPVELGGAEDTSNLFSFGSLEGYLNAKLFAEILRRMPVKEWTREAFIKTAETTKSIDIGMKKLVGFSANNHQASDAVFFTTVQNGKYVEILDWKKL